MEALCCHYKQLRLIELNSIAQFKLLRIDRVEIELWRRAMNFVERMSKVDPITIRKLKLFFFRDVCFAVCKQNASLAIGFDLLFLLVSVKRCFDFSFCNYSWQNKLRDNWLALTCSLFFYFIFWNSIESFFAEEKTHTLKLQ